ncbi:MAG: 50S ribosomal protein L10 [Candidatus Micrarchaeia archaeon]
MLTRQQKIEFVNKASEELKNYKTVGVVSLNAVPDRLLQRVRNTLKGEGRFILGRKTALQRILESNEHTKRLAKELTGTSAIVLTNKDPFELYEMFKSNAIKLAAKPKQVANEDIKINEGETSLQPGQAVTELKKAGIDVQMQKGKVVIAKSKVLVSKGSAISTAVANALHILGITPFTAMLEPRVIESQGVIYTNEVFKITREGVLSDIIATFSKARAVALQLNIATPYTIAEMIAKAYRNAVALGLEAKAYDTGIVEKLISKAVGEAASLGASQAQ